MALNKFFRFPFATTGDKTVVPDTVQPDGSVSYTEGFGADYGLPSTDPDRKPVPRNETNQYLFDITTAIRENQIMGVPDWITNAQNGGSAFSYDKGARVRYTDGNIYRSLAASNTALPTSGTWALDEAYSLAAVLADEATARARTDNTKLMSPLRVAQAIAQQFIDGSALSGTDARFTIPGLGWMVQMGVINIAANGQSVLSGSFSFGTPFSTAVMHLSGSPTDKVLNWNALTCILKSTSVNGGTYILDTTDPSQVSSLPTSISWIAIGR